jgi:uncharacterized protein HemY
MQLDIWKILNSKWIFLVLTIGMGLAVPSLYHNVKVVWTMPNVPLFYFWTQTAVFAMCVITMLMALFKFLNCIFEKKADSLSNESDQVTPL